jgi:SAM-dependent methyltransferase
MKTYQRLSGRRGCIPAELVASLRALGHTDHDALAREHLRRRDLALGRLNARFDIEWSGCHLLDVGAGQLCVWSLVFSEFNDVNAIDLDVIPHGPSLTSYWRMWRDNGPYRVAKTLVRKIIGVDRRQWASIERVSKGRLHWPVTYLMNAESLEFDNQSFDGVFSFSAFEHIAKPAQAMREIARVLKPGGAAYIVLELFSSLRGSHDPRMWTNLRALPLWAHLRPSCDGLWQPNVYLNQVRLGDFRAMAEDAFDEVCLFCDENDTRRYVGELSPEEREELAGFSDEELCTQDLVILGRIRP